VKKAVKGEGQCAYMGMRKTPRSSMVVEIDGSLQPHKSRDSGLEVRVGPMVDMFFPPPFTAFNLGERCAGTAGGFRRFTGGTGGADLVPEGEGVTREGASCSGPGRRVRGEVVSYIPIESARAGCGTGGWACLGIVSFESDRSRFGLEEATATLGKLFELSVLAFRGVFPLR